MLLLLTKWPCDVRLVFNPMNLHGGRHYSVFMADMPDQRTDWLHMAPGEMDHTAIARSRSSKAEV